MGLYVHESGDAGAPAVVFLHGNGVSGRMWSEHMGRLRGYHCLAPDLPGFGRSRHIAWESRITTARLVVDLIEERVPARKAHLVGLSMGGAISHALLAMRADLLGRVIVDSAGALPTPANAAFLLGIAAIAPFLHTAPVIDMLANSVGGFSEREREDLRACSRWAFLRGFVHSFATRPTRAALAAPCPTLFVCGENEGAIRPSNAAFAALMPHATARYVPGTGHGWLGLRPELHRAMVEAWLSAAPLPDGLIEEPTDWPRRAFEHLVDTTGSPAGAATRRKSPRCQP